MKNTFCLIFLSIIQSILAAQSVSTVAGVPNAPGYMDGPALESLFNNPHGVAVDPQGNIYVADRFNHRIRKIGTDGQVTTLAGSGIPGKSDGKGVYASFNEPWDLCYGADGFIYVADTRNNLIRKIDNLGNVTTYAGSGNYGSSDGLATSATFGNPTGIEMNQNGELYIADHLTHIIRKIDTGQNVTTLAGMAYLPAYKDGSGTEARFFRPYGLTIDEQGNIIVADEWNHRIRLITPNGNVSTIAGSGNLGSTDGPAPQADFNYPWDVTTDDEGNIYIADGDNHVIRRISGDEEKKVTTIAGQPGQIGTADGEGENARFSGATGIAFLAAKNEIIIGDAYNHTIRKISKLQRTGLHLISQNGKNIFCFGETIIFFVNPQAYSNHRYFLDGILVQNSPKADFAIQNLPVGSYTIQVEAEEGEKIHSSDPLVFQVMENPHPSIEIFGPTTFYEGDSVILIASNANDYLWSTGTTSQTLVAKQTGSYTVQVTDGNGCIGLSDSVAIEVIPVAITPKISLRSGGYLICNSSSAILESNYEEGNQWYRDGWPIEGASGNVLEVRDPGYYQLQVKTANEQYLVSEEIFIDTIPKLLRGFRADNPNPNPNEPIVSFVAEVNWEVLPIWDFGDPFSGINNQSTGLVAEHEYQEEGTYTITLTAQSEEGCKDTLVKKNYINFDLEYTNPNPPNNDFFIPSAFTPNGDGNNDILYVRGQQIGKVQFYICNKWGRLVFQSSTLSEGWDGTIQGVPAQSGTYTYFAKIELLNGITEQVSGHVTLLR